MQRQLSLSWAEIYCCKCTCAPHIWHHCIYMWKVLNDLSCSALLSSVINFQSTLVWVLFLHQWRVQNPISVRFASLLRTSLSKCFTSLRMKLRFSGGNRLGFARGGSASVSTESFSGSSSAESPLFIRIPAFDWYLRNGCSKCHISSRLMPFWFGFYSFHFNAFSHLAWVSTLRSHQSPDFFS